MTATFVPPGLNDLSPGGKFTASENHVYRVIISATGMPDRFRWSVDGGALSPEQKITGTAQPLPDGVTITFRATTGHTMSTQAKSFWMIAANASGPASQTTFRQRGAGALTRSLESKLRDTVDVRDFGAKCDGATDDTVSIQNALDSLPLMTFERSYSPDGMALRTGVVELPATGAGGCLISNTLQVSPYVTFHSRGGGALIITAVNFAPARGKAAITGVTCTPGANCTVRAANAFSNGDTVEIHGVNGPGVNTWQNLNGLWSITGVTSAGFQLSGSAALPQQPPYASGGVAVKGAEKFAINIINAHGGVPNDNFDVNLGNLYIVENAAGNEFASGIFCNCSIDTHVHSVNVTAGYRDLVAISGTDNASFESLTLQNAPFVNGPDPQAAVIYSGNAIATNTINITNLKVIPEKTDNNSGGFSADTPAVYIGGQASGISVHGANFEAVPWPIAIAGTGQDIDLEEIIAFTDSFSAPCRVFLPWVVQIGRNQTTTGSGIKITGSYQCYKAGVVIGTIPVSSLAAPAGNSDIAFYSLGYDDRTTGFLRSGEIHAMGSYGNAAPSGTGPFSKYVIDHNFQNVLYNLGGLSTYFPSGTSWTPAGGREAWTVISAWNGSTASPAAYFRPGGIVFPRPSGAPIGTQCWGIYPGTAEADSNPSMEFWSYGSCSNLAANPHLYAQFAQGTSGRCPADSHVCLDPTGTESVGVGGNLNVTGRITGTSPVVTVTAGNGLSGGGPVAPSGTVTLMNAAPLNSISPGATCSGSTPHVTGVTAMLSGGAINLTVTCGP